MKYHIFSSNCICLIGAYVDHLHGLMTGFAQNYGVDL